MKEDPKSIDSRRSPPKIILDTSLNSPKSPPSCVNAKRKNEDDTDPESPLARHGDGSTGLTPKFKNLRATPVDVPDLKIPPAATTPGSYNADCMSTSTFTSSSLGGYDSDLSVSSPVPQSVPQETSLEDFINELCDNTTSDQASRSLPSSFSRDPAVRGSFGSFDGRLAENLQPGIFSWESALPPEACIETIARPEAVLCEDTTANADLVFKRNVLRALSSSSAAGYSNPRALEVLATNLTNEFSKLSKRENFDRESFVCQLRREENKSLVESLIDAKLSPSKVVLQLRESELKTLTADDPYFAAVKNYNTGTTDCSNN